MIPENVNNNEGSNMAIPKNVISSTAFVGGGSGGVQSPHTSKVTSGISATHNTTEFVDDAVVVSNEVTTSHRDLIYKVINDTQPSNQTIQDFLAKPIRVGTGTLDVADTLNSLITFSVPDTFFNTTNGLLYLQKLYGVFGISFDMRFRFVYNATRFQQGRYIMGYVPMCSSLLNTPKELAILNMHIATRTQKTTCSHVEMDIATGTTSELFVPFMSPLNFYSLNDIFGSVNNFHLGWVYITPYTPLVSPSSGTTVPFTLYVTLENIQLFGASSPQSGLADKEVTNKENGPISSVARSFAKGFSEFSNVPLLSTYTRPIAWAADRIAKASAIFGFSKPTSGDDIKKMSIINNPSHTTVDGDSDVRPLGLLEKPAIGEMAGLFGDNKDEMDFSYLFRKSAFFAEFDWTVGTAADTNIFNTTVYPNYASETTGGVTYFHYPPVAFVAQYFRYWRGSLKYKFKIVKTEFHSGRIAVQFFPGDPVATYTANPFYVNRQIIDIRETTEFEIVVPFISRYAWQATNVDLDSDYSTGRLIVQIVDPLVAPSTVSSTVKILVEISGGDDFEVAVPVSPDIAAVTMTPHSGLEDTKLVSTTVGNTDVVSAPLISSTLCIGDKVSNFRAYLKRYAPIDPAFGGAYNSTSSFNSPVIDVIPDFITTFNSATAISASRTYYPDPFSTIGSCYAMFRGGIRLRDVVSTSIPVTGAWASGTMTASVTNSRAAFQSVIRAGISPAITRNTGRVLQTISQNNGLSVELPQYTRGYARSVAEMMEINTASNNVNYSYNDGSGSTTTSAYVNFALPYSVPAYSPDIYQGQLHNIYRSISDDASFGTFISVPPMFRLATIITFPQDYGRTA